MCKMDDKLVQAIWNNCLIYIKNTVTENVFELLEPVTVYKFENKKLILISPVENLFYFEILDDKWKDFLRNSIKKYFGRDASYYLLSPHYVECDKRKIEKETKKVLSQCTNQELMEELFKRIKYNNIFRNKKEVSY